jgi:hypothetical protein
MEIELVSDPTGSIVAWVLHFGAREGRFVTNADGSVSYLDPADHKSWHAGANMTQFRASVEAWNTYLGEAKGKPEATELVAVAKLRACLEHIDVLREQNSVWSALLEQAELGTL